MKKIMVLSALAAILFLVPSVQAQDWHGPRGCSRPNYRHQWQAHPNYHGRHHQPPGWGHANVHHGWNQRNWHSQPAGWGNNQYSRNWHRPLLGLQNTNYRFR
jgi:hypothetical protein